MIAVRPDNLAGQILAAIVARPGVLDVEGLAQVLFVPRLTGSEGYPAWFRAAQAAKKRQPEVSALLGRLQSQGLILPLQAPRIGLDYREGAEEDLSEAAAKLLKALVQKRPPTMRGWVGSTPSGATQRAVADLVELGLVVPPSRRWPSETGVALVSGWRAAA